MSAATMAAPVRQPFGSVSGSRLRNLTNLKNKQNAIPSTPSTAIKRHAPAEFDDVDSENIDPLSLFSGSNKKSKAFEFDNTTFVKTPSFTLGLSNPVPKRAELPQVVGHKRKTEEDHGGISIKRQEPSSAPAPAGRSPKSKHRGLLSRRRFSANPFGRVDPPAFAPNAGLPFSIDAALAGTVSTQKTKTKSRPSSKGWHFEIHEDSPADEMANLMEHSTCTLEISDDEGRQSPKGDRDNKENIPPLDFQTMGNVPTSRRDLMTDEPRSPLGDLDAKEYYPEGCDASSIFVVPADDVDNEKQADIAQPISAVTSTSINEGEKLQQGCQVSLSNTSEKVHLADTVANDEETPEIQIWESESAKAEDEVDEVNDPGALEIASH